MSTDKTQLSDEAEEIRENVLLEERAAYSLKQWIMTHGKRDAEYQDMLQDYRDTCTSIRRMKLDLHDHGVAISMI